MTNSLKTQPVSGVTVTKPAQDMDKAFQTLFDIAAALPPFLESQAAMQRLTEANFWLRHAVNIKQMHDERMSASKKEQNKIIAPGINDA